MSAMSVYEDDVSSLLSRVMSRVPETAPVSDVKPWDLEDRRRPAAPQPAPAPEPAPASDAVWRLQAIEGQTRVTSNFGKVPAQLLRKGDVVRTRQRRFVPIKAIREYKLDLGFLHKHPEAMPVMIPRGVLAGNLPFRDVFLSPAQVMNIGSERIRPEPVKARDVVRGRQMTDAPLGLVAYYQIVLDQADDVDCDGIWVRCGG